MKVLVTGASGKLGRAMVRELKLMNLSYIEYSHIDNLSHINWLLVSTIINCSGTIPSRRVSPSDFYDGNVLFLQNLLLFCKNKKFIHFSTFSELYRNDHYQRSKMLANSLLIANSHFFAKLDIITLPTLDDKGLLESIVKRAKDGKKPVVDFLEYNYMSFDDVAKHVVKGVVAKSIGPISMHYVKRNLYDEVCKKVSPKLVIKGSTVNRHLNTNGMYCISSDLLGSLHFKDGTSK